MVDKTYEMVRLCIRCLKKLWITVPFGESVPEVEEGTRCEYCGCEFFSHAFHPEDPRAKGGID